MENNLKQLIEEKEAIIKKLENANKELSLMNSELIRKNVQSNEVQEQMVRAEKLSAVGTLASGVSHELRNPLSAIKNAVFLLKRKLSKETIPDIDEKIIQFLDIMDNEIDRCSKITNDLLGFTRISEPSRLAFDINTVVNDALSRVEIAENIKLSKNLQPDLPMIMIDANQIGQVLINLIQNAYQAMTDGGNLKISTKVSDGFMEVEVGDSGCGIPEKEIKKIFDPLFTTKPRGTGIGLAVCHGIIQKHNGVIDVKSQEGVGTTMFIRLPLEGNDSGSARQSINS